MLSYRTGIAAGRGSRRDRTGQNGVTYSSAVRPDSVLTIDWATVASFATALGTLVLALATFAAIRSSNRSARIAEASFQVNLRPVLVTSRLEDPKQKIRWIDDQWAMLEGSQGVVQVVDGRIYLAISLRNVGSGLAVTFGWAVPQEYRPSPDVPHVEPEDFRMQTRDLYIASGDVGFWQAAIRETTDPMYGVIRKCAEEAEPFTIEVLYGDTEGGQRTISRFGMIPVRVSDEIKWFPAVARHWNLDRPDPR
jgi:hypothetical protein